MKTINRKFMRDYEAVESFEAGLSLIGAEVKSVRQGGLRLEGSYIAFLKDGPHLVGADISKYRFAENENYDSKRSRKILLTNKEILRIKGKLTSARGLTVVPVSCYNKGALLKLEIALARGRKDLKKRKYDKQKTIDRNEKREVKEYIRG
ncbi:MAG TPA: SsrA-binding protein [Candidatus Dojkabacteria bacterium]